ncbi:hypothetical protein [Isachenkonia alkalipeptolytica]|uniref:Uncharacterized protein n=1 Tax=Isachenkonia alkalipeptolytica TaxID=2565777 RepID=A0AA44BF37_9CLOT|nr:hypothetical protein [Isachenkonia alkalipeptolytica]NBG88800.1 hypothetical protein [Isachenkonia alkalipeptolytica]
MNKHDFTKSILDQLGQSSSPYENTSNNPKKNPNRNEQSGYPDVRKGAVNPPPSPGEKQLNLLAVFTGTNRGIDQALEELKRSREYGISFDVAFSWNGKDLQDIKNIQKQLGARNVFTEVDKGEITRILERVDGIVVPMTTQNTTSKLSKGILDDFISTLLWEGLWRGKKMVLNLDSVVAYKGQRSKVPEMQKMVDEMIEKIEKMGVVTLYGQDYQKVLQDTFLKQKALKSREQTKAPRVQPPGEQRGKMGDKTIITEKDLTNMNSPLKILTVPFNTIVTPLAWDRAKTMGIEIKKEQG